jgi:FdhD protein
MMTERVPIVRFRDGVADPSTVDEIAVEAPLQICVQGQPVAVAMRTPGHDVELACGWAFSEGIVRQREDVADVVSRPGDESQPGAMVDVILREPEAFDLARHRRNIITNASCGLCGATSVEQVLRDFSKIDPGFITDANLLPKLPPKLRAAQPTFTRTGGVHACGLFNAEGNLGALREDVGRHNALDKLIGWAFLEERLPLASSILLLSGRISLEMVQKSVAAGIPVVAAIGAPSTLAVELAAAAGQTLAGFLREQTFNVYAGKERLRGAGGL